MNFEGMWNKWNMIQQYLKPNLYISRLKLHQFTFCLGKNAFGHTQQSHHHKDYNTVGHLPETQMEKKGAVYDDYINSLASIQKIMNMYISQQHLHVTKQNMSNLSSAFDKLSSVSLSTRTHVQHESFLFQ